MHVRGKVIETIMVEKEVSVVIPDLDPEHPEFEQKVEMALRAEANKRTIVDEDHGWDLTGSEGQDVEITEKPLRCMVNHSDVDAAVKAAFLQWIEQDGWRPTNPDDTIDEKSIRTFFEHGCWHVEHFPSGAIWAAADAEGGPAVDGFDFEQISEGDNE